MLCSKCNADVQEYVRGAECRRCYNRYMAEYMLAQYQKRKEGAIRELGGKCHQCRLERNLDVVYRFPELQTKKVGRIFSFGEIRFKAELKKCILLCSRCRAKNKAREKKKE